MTSWKDPVIIATDLNAPRLKFKALSIRQPWANMVARSEKPIETRTWKTSYRGSLLIVSSKRPPIHPAGYVLATAQLVDVRIMTKEDEAAAKCCQYWHAWAWILEDLKELKQPIPIVGRLGLYDVQIQEDLLEIL